MNEELSGGGTIRIYEGPPPSGARDEIPSRLLCELRLGPTAFTMPLPPSGGPGIVTCSSLFEVHDGGDPVPAPPPVTSCKHGLGDCERCGTSDARDVRHSTRGGRGAVARIRRSKA